MRWPFDSGKCNSAYWGCCEVSDPSVGEGGEGGGSGRCCTGVTGAPWSLLNVVHWAVVVCYSGVLKVEINRNVW